MKCFDHNLINFTKKKQKKTEKSKKKIFDIFFSPPGVAQGTLYLSPRAEFQKSVLTIRFFGQENPVTKFQVSSFATFGWVR